MTSRLRLTVNLKHLALLGRAREERVVRLGRDPDDLELVPLRVEAADEVVPRVHAAADVEVASVRKLVSRGERRRDRATHLGGGRRRA